MISSKREEYRSESVAASCHFAYDIFYAREQLDDSLDQYVRMFIEIVAHNIS